MSHRTKGMPKYIDRLAMDSLVYAVKKSLESMGEGSQTLKDRMGDLMLEYLIDTKRVNPARRRKEFERSLRRLLGESGFDTEVPVRFTESPPGATIPGFLDYLGPGAGKSPRESPGGRGKVDWVLFEMVLYGVTKALDDQLGAQAQLILTQIGGELVDYLVDEGAVKASDDPEVFFQGVKNFFVRGGFAEENEFNMEGSPPRALTATWTNAPYYSKVLKRLRSEGSTLLSCPVCLAGESILTKYRGLRFQNFVEVKFLPGAKVYYRHKIYPQGESFTEEDAQKISRMG